LSASVLITGGAGFIGSALSRRLVEAGREVAVMDVLHSQVHGGSAPRGGLPQSVALYTGDVTNSSDWDAVLQLIKPAQLVHLAAETGTGQSLTEANRHGSVNVVGTTQLIDALNRADFIPDHVVLASSRAVYGEGAWRSGSDVFYPGPRTHARLTAGIWDPEQPDGEPAVPVRSSAARTWPNPTSIYGATKLAQEHILQAWTAARGNGLSVLRLQNVYGVGQSLTNPYTGVVSLFGQIARAQQPIEVYEDGRIIRDFIYVNDAVEAIVAAVDKPPTRPRVLDVGSGSETTVLELATRLAVLCGSPEPRVVGRFRDGDVRAAICDIGATTAELSWQPRWSLNDGLGALLDWIELRRV
jgi:dTDP-L-rhamnose 4-epimerase